MPTVGEIDNRHFIEVPYFSHEKFGDCRKSEGVIEVIISENPTGLVEVGKIGKEQIFKDYPKLILNINATSAKPNEDGISDYPNPQSHWFNVFLGFYEIDTDGEAPFGFTKGGDINMADIIKIGKFDWNIITGYSYGIPYDVCIQQCKLTGREKVKLINQSVMIGKKEYVEVELTELEAVSPYPAHEELLDNVSYGEDFRKAWGVHGYVEGYEEPFMVTRIKSRLYIRWFQEYDTDMGKVCFKTIVAGGTINMDYPDEEFNEEFLEFQMSEMRKKMIEQDI
jgi:hypothetical protein